MSPPFWKCSLGGNVFCWSLCAPFFFFFPWALVSCRSVHAAPRRQPREASQGRTQALGISLFEALFFLVFVSL